MSKNFEVLLKLKQNSTPADEFSFLDEKIAASGLREIIEKKRAEAAKAQLEEAAESIVELGKDIRRMLIEQRDLVRKERQIINQRIAFMQTLEMAYDYALETHDFSLVLSLTEKGFNNPCYVSGFGFLDKIKKVKEEIPADFQKSWVTTLDASNKARAAKATKANR